MVACSTIWMYVHLFPLLCCSNLQHPILERQVLNQSMKGQGSAIVPGKDDRLYGYQGCETGSPPAAGRSAG